MAATPDSGAVAIIGMAGRFPGARDIREFWSNLVAGVDAIRREPDAGAARTPREGARAWSVGAGGVLDDVELFDADFFSVPPLEAAWMDPQHRLFLECAWLALEDAARHPSAVAGAVAVYAGANFNTYLSARLDQLGGQGAARFMQVLIGNEKDFLATRVSYKLNLRGESITVQTSCSTSLVAVHLACQSLLSGQSDLALAGGVSIRIPQRASYRYEAGMIASPDGYCRPFDHRAAGTVPGNGVGVVVLKRLEEAIADRDHCYAVIKGSWVNNDGCDKVGFTAPAVAAQTAVVARALAMADVSAETIRYVETHGTGTPIGDPIEIEALTAAFRRHTARQGYCALGAVKAGIGHLDTAAGVAGLIKAALALRHRVIPPSAYFERPNPALDLERSPFYVSPHAETWEAGPAPRRAGVSGFGVGGTNVHVVLEEPPVRTRSVPARAVQIVTVSAKTAAARESAAARLAQVVDLESAVELRDVAYTQNVGRTAFACRRFAVAATPGELARTLRASGGDVAEVRQPPPAVVFMFPGQGAQSIGMARAVYESEPVFRQALDACLERADAHLGDRLGEILFEERAGGDAPARLARPEFTLPALFAVEYALVALWRAWGVTPDAVIGHSYGELVAACVAGVFSADDAIALAVARGRLLQRMPPGLMIAVPLPEAGVAPFVGGEVSLASINGASRTVLAGPAGAIEGVERELAAAGVASQRLAVPFAYHSALVDPVLDEYAALVQRMPRGPLRVRCVSNRTGEWLTDAEASDPRYWARQMREPVRFAAGLERLQRDGPACFVEIGPGRALTPLARSALGPTATVVASLAGRGGAHADLEAVLTAAGRLWLRGVPVDWQAVEHAQHGWAVPLPGYAFERQRHWVELSAAREASDAPRAAATPSAVAPPPAVSAGAVAAAAAEEDLRTPVERALVAIWSAVFGRPSVGVDEDFLELGGDSLTAIRVQSRVHEELGVDVGMERLLTLTTIAALAADIEARMPRSQPAAPPAAAPAASEAQPLSLGQEWLWTLHTLTPASPAYHLPIAVRLRGPFAPAAFACAVRDVARRHETLRTAFALVDGRPVAIVGPWSPAAPVVDLTPCRSADRMTVARRAMTALIMRPFDLASPPWRACVLRIDGEDHVGAFVLHHIVTDAWSMGLLASEVAACYAARRDGRTAALPDLPIQYTGFARRQRASIDRDGADLVAFWKRQLAGVPPLLTLSRRPRPPVRSHRGARYGFAIEAGLVARLNALARRQRSTLFMVLLAAFEALVHRLTGESDFCVGAPTAGRLEPDLEPLIGCFINTLPMRADLRGDPTFLELLQRVRRTVLDAFAHQALPFGRIVQELRPPRSPSYTPFFQVIVDFNSTPRGSPSGGDPALRAEPFGMPMTTAKNDLIVDLSPGADGRLHGGIEYDAALFGERDVAAMMGSFSTLLGAVASDPARRVASLPIESDDARSRRSVAEREHDAASRDRLLGIRARRRTGRGAPVDA